MNIYETFVKYLRFLQLKMPVICQNTDVSPLNSYVDLTGAHQK